MKTLRDDAHQKLTGIIGEITAQTLKMQTYTDAIRRQLRFQKEQYECIKIHKEEYEQLQQAVHDLDTHLTAKDFVNQQIRTLLEKHAEWTKQNIPYTKR